MKTNWIVLLLVFTISFNLEARNTLCSGRFIQESDTLLNERSKSADSLISGEKIIVRDTLNGEISLISDSLVFDMLLSDTISTDSVLNDNPVYIDTLSIDSLSIDTLVIDSIKVDTLKNNVMKADTLLKKDGITPKHVAIIPKSVKDLQLVYSNFRKESLEDQERWDDIYLSLSEIEMKPVYYKYVVPLTYYSKPFLEASSIDSWYPKDVLTIDSAAKRKRLMDGMPRVDHDVQVSEKIDRQLLDFYVEYPQLVLSNESRIDSLEVIRFDEMHYSSNNSNIISLIQNNAGIGQVEESDILVIKPNFWTYGGNGYLQFSQNYISDNWYKGGESTKSLLSGFTWQIKYDDKQKLQYEGKLEWKLGFITAPSDTVHSYKTNNDLLRLSSKLGYKAIQNWYYTLSAEFQTQLMSNYATNSDNLVSAFFSPATLNVGVGMDYKLIKDGALNLSVLLNPLNYTMYSIVNDEIDPTKFNIKEGHKVEHELGSRINSTLTWKMFPFLLWESKFSYTTNYEKVFSEWENTFTFVINKYLSTKLFVHTRYDDSVTPKEGEGYLQLQELFSFGVNYTW